METHTESKQSVADQKIPDGGWGWMIVAGAGLGFFFSAGLHRSFTILYEMMMERFGGSAVATAWVISLHSAIKMCSSPLVSALCNRCGHRVVVMAGGVLSCIGMVASGYVPSLPAIYLTFSVVAVGMNMFVTASNAMISHYFEKKRGIATSIATIFNGIGAMVLGPTMVILVEEYAYSGTLVILGGCTLHFCISGALYRPLHYTHTTVIEEYECNDVKTVQNENATSCSNDTNIRTSTTSCTDYLGLRLFSNAKFATFCILLLFVFMTTDICTTFMTALAREKHFTNDQITLLLVVSNSMDIPFRLLSGILFDIRSVRQHRRLAYIIVTMITGAIVLLIPIINNVIGSIIVWCAYMGFRSCMNCHSVVVAAHIVGTNSTHVTSAMGLTRFFQGIGMLIGPTTGGLLKDLSGSYGPAFWMCGSLLTFVSVSLILEDILPRKRTCQK